MHEIIAILFFSLFASGAWAMVYVCLREKGCNVFMVSGYLTLPKEDRVKYKAKFDVVAMNRYAGKWVYLPLAVTLTLMIPVPVYHAAWYGIILGTGAVITLALCFKALPGLIGTKFEYK